MFDTIKILFRSLKIIIKKRSYRRGLFYFYETSLKVSSHDNDMLLAQLGYFGHHVEKALKHQNRGNRGLEKKNKLEIILNEVEKRKINEPQVIEWAKHLIKYFNTNQDMYINPISKIENIIDTEVVLKFIKNRTTTRFWLQKEVSDEIIESIIETAMTSSLSCNRQTIRFVICKNKIDNIITGDSNNKSMFYKAPIIIYIADDERFFPEKYGNALDVGGVCSTLQLSANAYGLSSTWMYYADFYDQNKIRDELGLKKYMYVYSAIAIGYPMDKQEKPPRFSVEQFIIKKDVK